MTKKITLQKLERLLLQACDIMRAEIESSDYKKYIFAMIFLKRLSDQFEAEQEKIKKANSDKPEKVLLKKLNDKDNYTYYVPEQARWKNIKDEKTNLGNILNKALEKLEEDNTEYLEGVLKHVNFNETIGQKSLSDSLLVELVKHFNDIPLKDEDFEFPDLLGRAYEYLIKYFADDAGKKGGEFYTSGEVVKLLVNIIEPKEGDRILDPTVGSGGMLIQSKEYIVENGGNVNKITLFGQELKGATWSICKMNMLLHNIQSADIRQGDTLESPQHLENGELKRFDKVIANPPFSQNYIKKNLPAKYNTRFDYGYPPEKKKADFMFLQHMISVLNETGKMACVMPHGVLFRGGEEQTIREGIITDGILEAVIGLPSNLFYGTGIPACVLVINKKDKDKRKEILFINADKEYKEGVQNKLRPEDIQKIVNVYRSGEEIPKYSKKVKIKDLEDFNLNIRRYVDNSDDAPLQDVRAHLNGGVPNSEIELLKKECTAHKLDVTTLFTQIDEKYSSFIADTKETLKTEIMSNTNIIALDSEYSKYLSAFWGNAQTALANLPKEKHLYKRRKELMANFVDTFKSQTMLDKHKIEGIFAGFWSEVYSDLCSIENSGWNAELISDEYIVASQFPEVISKKLQNSEKIATLELKYNQMLTAEDSDDEEANRIKQLKEEKKTLSAQKTQANKNLTQVRKSLKESIKAGETGEYRKNLENVVAEAERKYNKAVQKLNEVEEQLTAFTAIEKEIKLLKEDIRAIDRRMGDLADKAREEIPNEKARDIILNQFFGTIEKMLNSHIEQHYLEMSKSIETLWDKYSNSLTSILKERDNKTKELNAYLKELGYEI